MATIVLLLVFAICMAAVWFHGVWGATITLINTLLAAMIATNYFEGAAAAVADLGGSPALAAHADFAMLWLIFFLSFAFLRIFSDLLTKHRVKFINKWVEMAGRTIVAAWVAWVMVVFVSFSLLTLPASADAMGLQATPQSGAGLLSPTRKWLGFVYTRSRQSLSGNEFDPQADFLLRYRTQRESGVQ
jgi:hypothetical protein